jgi:MFS transporter, YNFM family, putative membrane transport protein
MGGRFLSSAHVVTVHPAPVRGPGTGPGGRLAAGSAGLRRLQLAMAAAGLGAFAMLYSTQALLPSIGAAFGVGPTAASLTVSVTTGLVGLTVLPMSGLAERAGRTRVMTVALAVACAAVAAGGVSPAFWVLIGTRVLVGLALAGVVAVAMGHIGDEVEPPAAGRAIGLYVAGTTVGGLLGRLIPAGVEGAGGWRWSMAALGIAGALCTATFACLVPPARPQPPPAAPAARPRPGWPRPGWLRPGWPRPGGLRPGSGVVRQHLRDPAIVRLCAAALLLMGGFVAVYNYLTYRLTEAPFELPRALIGLIFLAYLAGTVTSGLAGGVAARIGRPRTMYGSIVLAVAGLALTLPAWLPGVLAGLVLFTTGFFGCHATASAWVTTRARTGKSHASALYLTAYYAGSSIGGTLIGVAWTHGGWTATALSVAACYAAAACCVAGLRDAGRAGQTAGLDRASVCSAADEETPDEASTSAVRSCSAASTTPRSARTCSSAALTSRAVTADPEAAARASERLRNSLSRCARWPRSTACSVAGSPVWAAAITLRKKSSR